MLDIGLEVRILRERLKISAKELAERIGLSQSQMSRLENGERRIDTQVLDRIARALDVDPSHFFRAAATEAGRPSIPARLPEGAGKLIRSERRKQHISAEDLALKLGKPKAVIQAIEEGKRDLDPELAGRILKILRLPANYFLKMQQEAIEGLSARVARLNEALAEHQRGTLQLGEAPALDQRGGEALGASPTGSGAREGLVLERRGVPFLGALGGGYPQRFDGEGRPLGEVTDFLYIPGLEAEGAFALRAVGSSMFSETAPSFRDGDLLVFGPGQVQNRDFAFVVVEGDEALFRRVFFDAATHVRLQPLDLSCPAKVVPRERIQRAWKLLAHVARG